MKKNTQKKYGKKRYGEINSREGKRKKERKKNLSCLNTGKKKKKWK